MQAPARALRTPVTIRRVARAHTAHTVQVNKCVQTVRHTGEARTSAAASEGTAAWRASKAGSRAPDAIQSAVGTSPVAIRRLHPYRPTSGCCAALSQVRARARTVIQALPTQRHHRLQSRFSCSTDLALVAELDTWDCMHSRFVRSTSLGKDLGSPAANPSCEVEEAAEEMRHQQPLDLV